MVKAKLVKYIVQDDVRYIFYDYIFTSPSLITEFSSADVKEYVALMMFSNTLKEVAMNYGVFIQSATQLNDGWSKKEIGLRDQNCLRGSKAIADKIDIGMIGVRINDEEMKQIRTIWDELKRQKPSKYIHEPNIVIDIYKNRRGEMNSVKIFRYFDYATCHAEDLFVTDASYKGIQEIGQLKYEMNAFDFLDLKTRGVC
jgi:replicative DNA helicase